MVEYRLERVAPDILEQLRGLSEAELRKVAAAICQFALDRAGLDSTLTRSAMRFLERGRPVPPRICEALEGHVGSLDDEYFDLHDRAEAEDPVGVASGRGQETSAWYAAFRKARAVAAVQFACTDNALFAAAEAAVEANAAADDDTSGLRAAVTKALAKR